MKLTTITAHPLRKELMLWYIEKVLDKTERWEGVCGCALIRCTMSCAQPLPSPLPGFKVRGFKPLPLYFCLFQGNLSIQIPDCALRAIVIFKILIRGVTSYILKSSVA